MPLFSLVLVSPAGVPLYLALAEGHAFEDDGAQEVVTDSSLAPAPLQNRLVVSDISGTVEGTIDFVDEEVIDRIMAEEGPRIHRRSPGGSAGLP